jgi:hypothetical protein
MRHPFLPVAAVAVAMAVLTGCVTDGRPSDCDDESVTRALTLTADSLTPSNPSVCRDQDVTLQIAAEADGFLHIHDYDETLPATEVSAGEEREVTFTADREGQFPIEFHPADDPEGVDVGIFTVYEP